MATIKPTQAVIAARNLAELEQIANVLRQHLPDAGMDAERLARELQRYMGKEYTTAELVAIRDWLVSKSVIEIADDVSALAAAAPTWMDKVRAWFREPIGGTDG